MSRSPSASTPVSDPEPRHATVLGATLSYADEGPREAPAVLALHGIPGSLLDFRYVAPLVTRHLRFVRVELPGFGGSAATDAALDSLAGRAGAVLGLAAHLGLTRFALLGHSMGGATALVLAGAQPARVSWLVLVASAGLRRHRGLGLPPRAFAALSRALAVPGLRRLVLAGARRAYRRRRFPRADEMTTAEYARHLRAIAALDFGELRQAVAAPRLPPALVAFSLDDPVVEPDIGRELAATLPGARALAWPAGGHNLLKSRARELAAALLDGLRGSGA
jgi:3-oxoadipate enol-lactonase